MRNKIFKFIIPAIILAEIFIAQVAFAQSTAVYSGGEASIKQFLCTPTTTTTGTNYGSGSVSGSQTAVSGQNNAAAGDLYNCINRIYRFAIILASVVGVFYMVLAGYYYMSSDGSSEAISKAKSMITSTIIALLILLGGFIFLKALNPDLVQFHSIQPPSVVPTSVAPPTAANPVVIPGDPSTGASANNESQLRQQFQNAGIAINKLPPATTVAGMQPGTVQEIINIKQNCGAGCNVTITGGTEPGHDSGACSHGAGYKFDLASDPVLTSYITSTFKQTATRSDGAPQWYDASTNTTFAQETTQGTGPHWDVKTGC